MLTALSRRINIVEQRICVAVCIICRQFLAQVQGSNTMNLDYRGVQQGYQEMMRYELDLE